VIAQMALPGIAPAFADNDPAPLEAPDWVLVQLREMAIRLLPAAHPAWIEKTIAGEFDAGPMMQGMIAGWLLGAGRMQ
jgi:hypothetical protein